MPREIRVIAVCVASQDARGHGMLSAHTRCPS
jgi:hypothetical protein